MNVAITFKDNTPQVSGKVTIFRDILMGIVAADIEATMKTSGEVPFLPKSTKWAQRGALRSSIRTTKLATGNYKVSAGEASPAQAYAAVQEAGIIRGIPIRNYSTPGTGPHWFVHAISRAIGRFEQHVQTAKQVAGLEEVI